VCIAPVHVARLLLEKDARASCWYRNSFSGGTLSSIFDDPGSHPSKKRIRKTKRLKSNQPIMMLKKTNTPFLWAMACGAGLFLLLQTMVNRLFARESIIAPSSSLVGMMPHPRRGRAPSSSSAALAGSMDLYDEFFSSPFLIDSGLVRLKEEMDRQMREFDRHFVSDLGAFSSPLFRGGGVAKPWDKFDIQQDDKQVTVRVSVPAGVGPDDINIEVLDGDVLHISGGSKAEKKGVRSWQHFEKRFALGRNMEQDKIEAKLKDGTLVITTPKAGHFLEKNVRTIPIKEEL
jgi:HSP20 family protein